MNKTRLQFLFNSKHRFIIILFVYLLLLTTVPAQTIKPVSPKDRFKKVHFNCSPKRLYLGDTITLKMTAPHGGDLAIVDPDGKFYWLIFWTPESDITDLIMDWKAFKKIETLQLNPGDLKGITAIKNSSIKEPIFTKTGWYKFLLSENLETDDGTLVFECKIYFSPERRDHP